MPYLMLLNTKGIPVSEWKLGDSPLSVGRGRDCDIVVEDPALSRQHFRVLPENGEYILEDLNSKGGTRVNDRSVQRILLAAGDMVEAGRQSFYFDMGQETYLGKQSSRRDHESTIGGIIRNLRLPDERRSEPPPGT